MKNQEQSNWDLILAKYISVWIWSILFGAAATMTYQLINAFPSRGVVFMKSTILLPGAILIFLSWNSLYKFLNEYILPKFFPQEKEMKEGGDNENKLNETSIYLKRAFKYLIGTAVTMVVAEIVEILFISI